MSLFPLDPSRVYRNFSGQGMDERNAPPQDYYRTNPVPRRNPGPMKPPEQGQWEPRDYRTNPYPNRNPGPMKPPEQGQWGGSNPYRTDRGPYGNTGPMPPRDGDMGQNANPWMRDPRFMQWLMSMFGGGRGF